MEPLDDNELNQLLREWDAPAAPANLRERIPLRPESRWRWLLTGSIRIPVPVGVAAVVALAIWLSVGRTPPTPVAQPASSITLADFQPVLQLEPRIVGSENEKVKHEKQEFR